MGRRYLFLLFSLLLSGCNLYSSMDSPSGDVQVLSAARACFDKGDYTCASSYYAKLSTTFSDQENSELALLNLDQVGASAGTFLSAVVNGSGNAGSLITSLANGLNTFYTAQLLNPNGSRKGAATRLVIFHAYLTASAIQNPKLQGLIRFVSSFASFS